MIIASGPSREPLRKEVVLSYGTGMRATLAAAREDCSWGRARKLCGIRKEAGSGRDSGPVSVKILARSPGF